MNKTSYKTAKFFHYSIETYPTRTSSFCVLFIIDDLWQGHFHSEAVIYTQKFVLQNLRIKKFFVYYHFKHL